MKNSKLYPAIVLSSICVIAALLLSLINMVTAPLIKDRAEKNALAALSQVLPEGKKSMSASDFIRGRGVAVGDFFTVTK